MDKVKFLTKLVTEQDHDREYHWRMKEYLVADTECVGPIVVPIGFEFDKNSIPPYLRWLFPVSGRRSDYAAALHDWLYVSELFPREVCDYIYYNAMKASKVSNWRAWAKYKGVKNFGWIVWNQHTKNSIDEARSHVDLEEIEKVLVEHGFDAKAHQAWNLNRYPARLGPI